MSDLEEGMDWLLRGPAGWRDVFNPGEWMSSDPTRLGWDTSPCAGATPRCSKLGAGEALGGAEFGSEHEGSPGTQEFVGIS